MPMRTMTDAAAKLHDAAERKDGLEAGLLALAWLHADVKQLNEQLATLHELQFHPAVSPFPAEWDTTDIPNAVGLMAEAAERIIKNAATITAIFHGGRRVLR